MAKKSLNNPSKPAVKTRSVRGVKVQTVKGTGTAYSRDSKPAFDASGNQKREAVSLAPKDGKKPGMTETKKAIRSGSASGLYGSTMSKKKGKK